MPRPARAALSAHAAWPASAGAAPFTGRNQDRGQQEQAPHAHHVSYCSRIRALREVRLHRVYLSK